jgi:hypothetical protein
MPQFEQSESRQLDNANKVPVGNSMTGRRIIRVTKGEKPAENLAIPEIGAAWPDSAVALHFNNYSLSPGVKYEIYTYHYSRIKDAYLRSTISSSLTNEPLKEKSDYITAWEYVLAVATDYASTSRPGWYATKTDGTVEDPDNYKWVLTAASIPAGWTLVDGGDEFWKNGIRSYKTYKTVVRETQYFESKTAADFVCTLIGGLFPPIDVHGLESHWRHWLVITSSVSIENSYYMVTLAYEYKKYLDANDEVKGWDSDLY